MDNMNTQDIDMDVEDSEDDRVYATDYGMKSKK